MRIYTQKGFTLIEMMIALVIIAITLSWGIPNFRSFIQNNRLASQTNELLAHISTARSEAVKRGERVVLCRSTDPNAGTPSCGGGTDGDWSTGWLMFVSGDLDSTFTAGTDFLLKRGQPTKGGIEVTSNTFAENAISYDPNGFLEVVNVGDQAAFAICDDRDGDNDLDEAYGREIRVINTGRPRTTITNITSCNNPT